VHHATGGAADEEVVEFAMAEAIICSVIGEKSTGMRHVFIIATISLNAIQALDPWSIMGGLCHF